MNDDDKTYSAMAKHVFKQLTFLKEEDFAFSVDVPAMGEPTGWDVYRITLNGRQGMVGFRLRMIDGEKKVEVGFLRAGTWTEAEVIQELARQAPS